MEQIINEKLTKGLKPFVIKIVNESSRHSGHKGDDGSGESHFRIMVVSDFFAGKSRQERQRLVYSLLDEELSRGMVHALSLSTLSPAEYDGM